jgi:leucine-zipper-like transcriptional regulator 1
MISVKIELILIFIIFSLFTGISANSFESSFTPRKNHKAIVFHDRVFIMGGVSGYSSNKFKETNDIWVSDRLNNWIMLTRNYLKPSRMGFSAVAFKDKLWIIGGYNQENGYYLNDVWNSTDGVAWKQIIMSAPFKGRIDASLFVFKDKLWLMGGTISSDGKYIPDVWNSETGTVWNKVTDDLHLFSYYECPVRVFNDRIYVFSYGNGIYSSDDCINWQKSDPNENGLNRKYYYSAEVFDGNLYVICGQDEAVYYSINEYLNEVWRSSDGINWTMISPYSGSIPGVVTPFSISPGRSGQASFVFNNRLFISGGYDGDGYLNDLWYTDDGIRWFKKN